MPPEHLEEKRAGEKRREISTATEQSRDLPTSILRAKRSRELPGGMNKGEGKKSHSRTV